MNQTTVARRIEALEHALKLQLFVRDNRGYKLTTQGLALLDDTKGMRRAASKVSVLAEQIARDDHGVIRFSGNAEAMQRFGVGLVSAFREQNPGISFELQIDIAWDKDQQPLEAGVSDVAPPAARRSVRGYAGRTEDRPVPAGGLLQSRIPEGAWCAREPGGCKGS